MTTDKRPHDCRNRLRDNGMPHPKSGCQHCRTGGLTGCPYERNRSWRNKEENEMTKLNLYEGARVKLRNGAICEKLGKTVRFGFSWTGVVGPSEIPLTWTKNGRYIAKFHDDPLDIVEILPAMVTAANPVINRIERADVEQFRKDLAFFSNNSTDMYQQIATKSAIYPGKGTPFGLMYVALGLAEAGEVQNKVKKAFRDDGVISFDAISDDKTAATVHMRALTPERRDQIIKELGGAFWYIAACCNEIDATMSEVAMTNLEEICNRTERGTLQGDGDDR